MTETYNHKNNMIDKTVFFFSILQATYLCYFKHLHNLNLSNFNYLKIRAKQ